MRGWVRACVRVGIVCALNICVSLRYITLQSEQSNQYDSLHRYMSLPSMGNTKIDINTSKTNLTLSLDVP